MQVRAGGKTGGANITDDLTLGHILAHRNHIVGHMHICGGKAAAMAVPGAFDALLRLARRR